MSGTVSIAAHGKGMLVKGDTKPLKECLRSLGGRWNRALTAWTFPAKMKDEVLKSLHKHEAVKKNK